MVPLNLCHINRIIVLCLYDIFICFWKVRKQCGFCSEVSLVFYPNFGRIPLTLHEKKIRITLDCANNLTLVHSLCRFRDIIIKQPLGGWLHVRKEVERVIYFTFFEFITLILASASIAIACRKYQRRKKRGKRNKK